MRSLHLVFMIFYKNWNLTSEFVTINPEVKSFNFIKLTKIIIYKNIFIFSAGLVGDDIFNWEIIVIGPPETLYEGNLHALLTRDQWLAWSRHFL